MLQSFLHKILYAFLICPVRATCPTHLILLYFISQMESTNSPKYEGCLQEGELATHMSHASVRLWLT
jgi:hypothetical protein